MNSGLRSEMPAIYLLIVGQNSQLQIFVYRSLWLPRCYAVRLSVCSLLFLDCSSDYEYRPYLIPANLAYKNIPSKNSTLNSWYFPRILATVLQSPGSPRQQTIYTGCHRRNGPNFGRVFLMFKYTDITQNTYIQS